MQLRIDNIDNLNPTKLALVGSKLIALAFAKRRLAFILGGGEPTVEYFEKVVHNGGHKPGLTLTSPRGKKTLRVYVGDDNHLHTIPPSELHLHGSHGRPLPPLRSRIGRTDKPHWTQTPRGRRRMAEIQRRRWSRHHAHL